MNKTFVFLHGAFQGGWAWRGAARSLRSLGLEAYTPTFTGCGSRGHLAMHDSPRAVFLADVENLFLYEDIHQAVLVCHGYSGMLAPVLARRLGSRVQGIVFLEAALPERGENFLDLALPPLAGLLREREQQGQVQPFQSSLFRAMELDESYRTRLRPFPMRAFGETYDGPEPAQWPQSAYLYCDEIQAPFNAAMLARARRLGLTTRKLDLDGVPVLGRFGELARVLDAVTSRLPQPEETPESGCGRPRMPEEMRLLYCPHYRRRMELARGHGH